MWCTSCNVQLQAIIYNVLKVMQYKVFNGHYTVTSMMFQCSLAMNSAVVDWKKTSNENTLSDAADEGWRMVTSFING